MATCSLAELQAKACDNGFTCLDDVTSKAIELELWYKLAGSTTTVSQLIKAACESGFACGNTTDENILAATELQLLCQIKNNNVTPPEPEPCTNIIPDGAMYDDTGAYFTAAVSGVTYTITPGDNDGSYSNNGQYPEQLFSGVPVNVTVLNTLELINPLGTPLPVTAVICAVTTTQFDIDASAGVGGSINPSGTTTVDAGDDITFTATPDLGYSVSQWLLDGNPVDGTDLTYTISGVNSDHTIEVQFAMVPLIPAMTDYTLPSGVASASSEAEFELDYAWMAFSGVAGYFWKADAVAPGWLQYQFPIAVKATAYTIAICVIPVTPVSWYISGSNDGVNWTILDTRTLQSSGTYYFSNSTAYLYYRYTQTTAYPCVSSLQFY